MNKDDIKKAMEQLEKECKNNLEDLFEEDDYFKELRSQQTEIIYDENFDYMEENNEEPDLKKNFKLGILLSIVGFFSFSAGLLSIMIGVPSSLVFLLSLFGGGSLVIGLSFVLVYIKSK